MNGLIASTGTRSCAPLLIDIPFADRPAPATAGHRRARRPTQGQPEPSETQLRLAPGERVAVVHSGDVENAEELRVRLAHLGYDGRTDSHSELLALLIELELVCAPAVAINTAVRRALARVRGRYALLVLARDWPATIVAVRQGSPMFIGIDDEGFVLGSDAAALAEHVSQAVAMEDGDVAVITPDGVELFDEYDTLMLRPSCLLDR